MIWCEKLDREKVEESSSLLDYLYYNMTKVIVSSFSSDMQSNMPTPVLTLNTNNMWYIYY